MSFAAFGGLGYMSLCFKDFGPTKALLEFDVFVADFLLRRAVRPEVGPLSLKSLMCMSIFGITKWLWHNNISLKIRAG